MHICVSFFGFFFFCISVFFFFFFSLAAVFGCRSEDAMDATSVWASQQTSLYMFAESASQENAIYHAEEDTKRAFNMW